MTRLISNINDNRIRYVVPVEISSSLSITGSLLTTAGITGSIQGTASVALTAITAQTASYVLNAVSSSFATTASFAPNYVLNSATSSFVTNSQTSSFVLSSQTSSMSVASSSFATTASFATQASSASYVSNLQQDVQITGSLSTKGTFSVGRITTSNAVIQRAQTPAGSYSTIFAAGTGIVDTFPYTQLDTHGATIDMRAGDPASDQYTGGILITANGNTSPLGEGNAIVFKNRSGTNTYTERMRITHDGNVGINKEDPEYSLDIGGNINANVRRKFI